MNREIIGGVTNLARETDRVFRRSGIAGRHIEVGGCVGYEYTVPRTGRPPLVVRYVHPIVGYDDDGMQHEVGSRASRKRRRKRRRARIKKKLKKAVKSKAFKALVKVAKGVASVVPGGAAVVTAATVAEKAARAIQAAKRAAKRGNLRPMKMLPGALKGGVNQLRALT